MPFFTTAGKEEFILSAILSVTTSSSTHSIIVRIVGYNNPHFLNLNLAAIADAVMPCHIAGGAEGFSSTIRHR